MLGRTYEGQNCSIAKSLELVGERWTMLILREVFLGSRRFDEMASRLGHRPQRPHRRASPASSRRAS